MAGNRKVPLVANDPQFYGDRRLRPDEPFEADEDDAEDIMALGLGRKDVVPRGTAEPLSAAKAKQKVMPKPAVKRKYVKSGKYKRKDMRAED